MLRGTVGALKTQLAAARAACTAAEAASQRATAETLSLQSELEKVRHHMPRLLQSGCCPKSRRLLACANACFHVMRLWLRSEKR